MGKYQLTPEHKRELEPWARKWIANAMSTKPMDDGDRIAMRIAIRGLYEAAGLTPPPDHRIVFVPSPLVTRLAGGFAAAIWGLRKKSSGISVREIVDDASVYYSTLDGVYGTARSASRSVVDKATSDAVERATVVAVNRATRAVGEATRAVYEATLEAVARATREATVEAVYEATVGAVDEATREAVYEAVHEAKVGAVYEATLEAVARATREATVEAVHGAKEWRANANRLRNWFVCEDLVSIAIAVMGPKLAKSGLDCAHRAWHMWQGGNQWSGWVAYVAFFREVVNLDIDYSKWLHWKNAAIHGGPRGMHSEFCIVSDRPEFLTVDDQNRPHSDTGPFCRWRDGFALYAHHGVRVPAWIVEYPERITAESVLTESNIEVRRVMIEKIGMERLLRDANATILDADTVTTRTSIFTTVDGLRNWVETNGIDAYLTDPPVREIEQERTLYRLNVPGDEPIVAVAVTCPSTDRRYVLRVPPSVSTCAQAVAWTFDVTPSKFAPDLET